MDKSSDNEHINVEKFKRLCIIFQIRYRETSALPGTSNFIKIIDDKILISSIFTIYCSIIITPELPEISRQYLV